MIQAPDRPSPPPIPTIPQADIPRRLAQLARAPTAELKREWRELFGKEPPAFSRTYLASRLAYRIQELAYGCVRPERVARLEALGDKFDGGNITLRRTRADDRPLAGTRLIREHRGVERACKWIRVRGPAVSLTFGHSSRNHRDALERLDVFWPPCPGWRMSRRKMPEAAIQTAVIQKRRCAVYTRKSNEEGLEKEFNSLHAQRDAREAYVASQRAEGWVPLQGSICSSCEDDGNGPAIPRQRR